VILGLLELLVGGRLGRLLTSIVLWSLWRGRLPVNAARKLVWEGISLWIGILPLVMRDTIAVIDHSQHLCRANIQGTQFYCRSFQIELCYLDAAEVW
jgi:hypothetical protein